MRLTLDGGGLVDRWFRAGGRWPDARAMELLFFYLNLSSPGSLAGGLPVAGRIW